MAVEIINEETTYITLLEDTADIVVVDALTSFINTSVKGLYDQRVINKVWDTAVGGGSWVSWVTDEEDPNGFEYPYPSNWGVSTSLYRVEDKVYSIG